MKLQNPILNFERTDRRTHRQNDGRTDKPKAICPFNFFKVVGYKKIDHFDFSRAVYISLLVFYITFH